MMRLKFFMVTLGILLLFSCHEKSPNEPTNENSHPQVDIPWPSLADSPWPMHHHDPQSTGRSPYVGPQLGKVVWKFSVGGPVGSSVAIGPDSTIYFATSYDTSDGSQRAYLYALTWDGNLKWKFRLAEYSNSNGCSPLIGADGTIYIGTRDNDLKAINPDGTLKWKFESGGDIYQLGMNIGLDGVLYFVDENNYLYAVDKNGVLNWKLGERYKFESSNPSGISLSPDSETLYLGCIGTAESDTNKGLIAVDRNGQVKWLFNCGWLEGTPLVDNSGNIFFCDDKGIFSVDPEGQLRWKYLANIDSRDITIDYDGNIYVSLWISGTQPLLFSFDNDGNIRWQLDISELGHVTSSLICDYEGTIYYASNSGVYAISSNGEINWKILIGENGWNCPALAHHFLFVGTWFRGPGREFYKLN